MNIMKINFTPVVKTVAMIYAASMVAMTSPAMAASHDTSLEKVIAGSQRSAANKARDKYRHPEKTLEFFGLKPDMTVVEIWPGGGGWYQKILAPYLHNHGVYYSAGFDLSATKGFRLAANKKVAARIAKYPLLYGKTIVTELAPPKKVTIAPAGSADMVLSFRNFHDWQKAGTEEAVMKAIYRALKPGGVYGIVDHRSKTAKKGDGYVKPSYLIKVAQEAGLVLVAKSDINANPKDNHTHEKGVWTLPPTLAGKAADRDKMKAIGESDRLTYKFIKPVK